MNELQKLKEIGIVKTFKANDYIFRQDETGDEMFIILTGSVNIMIKSHNTPMIVARLESGDFFGEMSLLEDLPRNATAIAENDTTLIAITKQNFQSFICEPTSIAYKIMINLCNQVDHLYQQLRQTEPNKVSSQIASAAEPNQSTGTTLISNPAESQTAVEIPSANDNTPVFNYGNLYPPGHKTYNVKAPATYNNFLVKSQAHCPVCNENFEGQKQLLSKMIAVKTDSDFRKHYKDFEPVWFSIWVCPHCYYSNFYTEYDTIPHYKINSVNNKTSELKKNYNFKFHFEEPRTIDQVFTAFYLALYSANAYNASSLKFGKIWLQLSWLYKDVNDEEMFNTASLTALDYYYKAVYTTDSNLSLEQMQQCNILLGELYLIKGDEKEAAKHFYSAIKKDGGKEAFNQMAEERVHDLRMARG